MVGKLWGGKAQLQEELVSQDGVPYDLHLQIANTKYNTE